MADNPQTRSELVLYQAEDGRTRIEVRLENETVWLTQKQMADLFQKDVRTINDHILNIFDEGELAPDSVIRKYRITAANGKSYTKPGTTIWTSLSPSATALSPCAAHSSAFGPRKGSGN